MALPIFPENELGSLWEDKDRRLLMWKLVQFLIMSAVVMSNVRWHWTPNPIAAGLIGFGAAFVVTLVLVRIADALRGITR
jgi:hypothetical protein